VDIVDPVPRQEPEVLVLDARLGSPPLAEGVHQRRLVSHCPLHHAVDLLVEVVVEAGQAERERPHEGTVEEIAPDEIERARAGLAFQPRETGRQRLDDLGDRVLEVFDDEVFDLGRRQLRFDVHGDPVVGRVVDDPHLIVRTLASPEPDFNGLSLQYPVGM
jgi:hypothetical protein